MDGGINHIPKMMSARIVAIAGIVAGVGKLIRHILHGTLLITLIGIKSPQPILATSTSP
jgi:hypothetical protein